MNWISGHPYLASSICALFLVIFGATIVYERSAMAPITYQPSTWSGAGGIVTANDVASDSQLPMNPAVRQDQASNYEYINPFAVRTETNAGVSLPADANDGFDELTSILSRPKNPDDPASNNPLLEESYSFIPTGLFSVPDQTPKDTPEQAELRRYGNDIGSIIQSFEQEHSGQANVLKNHFEDRDNPQKIAAMKNLAGSFVEMAHLIANTIPIPDQMRDPATVLAKSYLELGKYLGKVPDAKGDAVLYDAIVEYNGSAERFVTSFVNFALLFPASGVTFSQSEAGSVFMLQQQGGGSL